MEMEDRLARSKPAVDHDLVVLQSSLARRICDELEHPLGLASRKLVHVAEGVDVSLRQDEEMDRRLRIDVFDGDEPVGMLNVVAFGDELAKEAVGIRLRGQRFPLRSQPWPARARASPHRPPAAKASSRSRNRARACRRGRKPRTRAWRASAVYTLPRMRHGASRSYLASRSGAQDPRSPSAFRGAANKGRRAPS